MLLLAGAALLGPTGRDDVYKTLWPAHTFSSSGAIQNYNGEAVEQSSSLLHVILLGGLHRLTGVDLPLLNVVFILACGVLAVLLSHRLANLLAAETNWMFGLLLGSQPVMLYWAWGGLDAALAGLVLLAWLCAGIELLQGKGGKWMGWGKVAVAGMLLAMVRPEAPLVGMLGIAIAWFLAQKSAAVTPGRVWLGLVLALLVTCGLVIGWRLWLTGDWLPQSAMAKAGLLEPGRWLAGCKYLVRTLIQHPELSIPALGAVVWMVRAFRQKGLPSANSLVLGLLAAGLAFIVMSGGDWMENGRFLVPFLFPAIVLAWMWLVGGKQVWRKIGVAAWGLLSIGSLVGMTRTQNTGYPVWQEAGLGIAIEDSFLSKWAAEEGVQSPSLSSQFSEIERRNRIHLRDIPAAERLVWVTDLVYAGKQEPVVVLSQQAGMMPYHLGLARSGRFRFIDLVGLCTRDFTECPVTRGRGNFSGGLNMDLCYLFQDWPKIGAECKIPLPDVVFSLSDEAAGLEACVENAGYQVVYRQSGALPSGPSWLPGMALEAGQFIAVHRKWVLSRAQP